MDNPRGQATLGQAGWEAGRLQLSGKVIQSGSAWEVETGGRVKPGDSPRKAPRKAHLTGKAKWGALRFEVIMNYDKCHGPKSTSHYYNYIQILTCYKVLTRQFG